VPALIPVASIEDSVFNVVKVLRVPVLVLALCALLVAVVEMGSLWIELWRRRGQRRRSLEVKASARWAHDALAVGDRDLARASIDPLASSADMWVALQQLVNDATDPAASDWMSKTIADFDLRSVKRLDPSASTLVGSVLFQADSVNTPAALACAIVLLAIVVILLGAFSLLQHTAAGRRGRSAPFAGRPLAQAA
jgi:hypothetical protein